MPRTELNLRVVYAGGPPVFWSGGPAQFGVQDKDNVLYPGRKDENGHIVFDFTLDVRAGDDGRPVFTGQFASGSARDRFVYLSWRNATGEYAQRFGLRLNTITQAQVDHALQSGAPLTGTLVVSEQRATTTGANMGGKRTLEWH